MKVLGFLLIQLLFAQAWAKGIVQVAELSTVRIGDPIRLSVIATTEDVEPELLNKLNNIVVLEAVQKEGQFEFPSSEVALALRKKLSFQELQRITLKIPETVKVRGKRNHIYQADLRSQILSLAGDQCGANCEITFSDFRSPELNATYEVLSYRLDTTALRGAGSFVLPLQVETSQGRLQLWVTGVLRLRKEALVATRLISVGQTVAEDDVQTKKVDITFAKDGTPSIEDLKGRIAARMISAGQTIYFSDLKKAIAATRGQPVKIVIGDGEFEVTTQGLAVDAGSIGDQIKVKSADTNKLLSGELIDKGVVKVE